MARTHSIFPLQLMASSNYYSMAWALIWIKPVIFFLDKCSIVDLSSAGELLALPYNGFLYFANSIFFCEFDYFMNQWGRTMPHIMITILKSAKLEK